MEATVEKANFGPHFTQVDLRIVLWAPKNSIL
jgi:hypothetical protein